MKIIHRFWHGAALAKANPLPEISLTYCREPEHKWDLSRFTKHKLTGWANNQVASKILARLKSWLVVPQPGRLSNAMPFVVGTQPLVPLFEQGNHHSDLPLLWHSPRLSHNIKEMPHPWLHLNIQRLQHFQTDLINPWDLATVELFYYHSNHLQEMDVDPPSSSSSATIVEGGFLG